MLSRERILGISWNWRGMHQKLGATAGWLCFGYSVTGIAEAEMPVDRNINCSETSASSTHGKKVYTDYSGIPGDRRCLFLSAVHGTCVRSSKAVPKEDLQRKLADKLRSMMNLSLDGNRLNGLLEAISIHTFLRLGSHMCGVVSQNCSWLHMFFNAGRVRGWSIGDFPTGCSARYATSLRNPCHTSSPDARSRGLSGMRSCHGSDLPLDLRLLKAPSRSGGSWWCAPTHVICAKEPRL